MPVENDRDTLSHMSYVRWGEDGSDVYIYGSANEDGTGRDTRLVCCACYTAQDEDDMLSHIAAHRERGEFVPSYVDDELRHDRDHRKATGTWPDYQLRWLDKHRPDEAIRCEACGFQRMTVVPVPA